MLNIVEVKKSKARVTDSEKKKSNNTPARDIRSEDDNVRWDSTYQRWVRWINDGRGGYDMPCDPPPGNSSDGPGWDPGR